MKRLLIPALALLLILCSCAREEPPDFISSAIAYSADDGLHLCGTDGSGDTLISASAYISRISFSEDGRYILYNNSSDLFVYDRSDGSSALAAANSRCVGMTGGRFLLLSPTAGASLYDAASGQTETAVPQPEDGYISAVCASPDATRFAYTVSYRDAGRDYCRALRITLPGSDDVISLSPYDICADRNGTPSPMFWSSNGSTVVLSCAVSSDSHPVIYTIAVADSGPRLLSGCRNYFLPDSPLLSVSSDSAAAAVVKGSSPYIALISRQDLSVSMLPADGELTGLCVSPDGASAAYSSGGSIFIASNGKTLFLCGGQGYLEPRFSADGTQVYSVSVGDEISLCRSLANSAGVSVLVSGLRLPNAEYGEEYGDLYRIFEKKELAND